jgi:restriction endonuclease Mrr
MNAPVPADTVPDYQSLMLPMLRAAAAGERHIGAVVQTRLMIRHNVGCRIEEVLHVKKVDEDFFE